MQISKVVSSLIYKFSERLLVKGLGLIISVVLARLLSPTEFGQIAIIMVFINLSIVFIDSGLNIALVRDKDTTEGDYSTVFYISTVIALLFIGIIWIISPIIAEYYDDDALVLPMRVYSFSLIFGALNSILVAKMQREMMFGKMMLCNVIACVFSGVIGVAMAIGGYSIWSLICYYFASSVILSISLLIATRWHPILSFSTSRIKVLFSFGWKILISGLLCSIYNDVRTLIIGKSFGSKDLGYYNRGEQLPTVLSQTIDNAIQSVMLPVMAKEQGSVIRTKAILKRTLSTSTFLIMPLMFAMVVSAESLVTVLFTSKWLPSVIYMQFICIGWASFPMLSSCLIMIKALGRGDVYLKLEFVRRLVMLLILLISVFCFDSVIAIAIGFSISSWVDYFIVAICSKTLVNYGLLEQILDIWKSIFASVLMCCIMLVVSNINVTPLLSLLLQYFVGFVVYCTACYCMKVNALSYIVEHIIRYIKK